MSLLKSSTWFPGVIVSLGLFPAHGSDIITFPTDGGVLDVTASEFGAVPNDAIDDTAAIQAALEKHPNGNRIVYLPPGEYLVSDTLKWGGTHSGNAQKRTILQGAGEGQTSIRLPNSSPGFGAGESKALIWTGRKPAQRFRNAVRDLTVDVGGGNPGAIGIMFNASNQGCIRNVTIRAEEDSGKVGLDLGHTDEIGPLLVRHLTVEGFEVGISTKWPVNSNTFEHITLRGQRKFGWWNYHQMIFVRGLVSENSVPALYNEKNSWGTVTLIDSKIRGLSPDEKTPGILNQRQMVLRNVEVSGYAKSVDNADKGRDKGDVINAGLVNFDTSHKNVKSQFRSASMQTFEDVGEVRQLPVKETPVVPWGDPKTEWANIVEFGGDPTGKTDSSEALQKAIDSGAKTVYLPAGSEFRFVSEVLIRGKVERIIGLEGRFSSEGKGVWRLVEGEAPVVLIERMAGRSGGPSLRIEHESVRTLIVSSVIGFLVEGRGSGDIFLDDFCGRLNLHQSGQSAWCRQLNTEHTGTMLHNNGGRLWVLGMKTEKIGTIIETVNGGFTDLNGAFIYSNQGWKDSIPAFAIEDSTVNLLGLNERNFNRDPVSVWFRETQNGKTLEMKERAWVYLSK